MNSADLQQMDVTSLQAVLADLRKKVLPSRFEKAQQTEPKTLQLGLRTLKGITWLEFSWNALAPRIVQTNSPSKQSGESTLAKQIQYALRQMALIEIKQEGFERIVEFGLANRPSEPIKKTLLIEIMGRHSNLLLLDENRKVITLGRQIRQHQSRLRPIGTGDIYVPPPPLQGIEPSKEETLEKWRNRLCLIPTNLKDSLQQCYQGISPSLALQLIHDDQVLAKELLEKSVLEISEVQWKEIYKRWCSWLDSVEKNTFSFSKLGPTDYKVWPFDKEPKNSTKELSLTLGEYYQEKVNYHKLIQLDKEIKHKILISLKSEKNSLDDQIKLLDQTKESNALQIKADNLLCIQSPTKDMIHEAQRLYKRAKKLRRGESIIKQRISYHEQRLSAIQATEIFREELFSNEWEEYSFKIKRLYELKEELENYFSNSNKGPKKNYQNKRNRLKPLELSSPRGLVIQIGRNHSQNELISLRQAKTGDIWFHAQECPGSHVVLKASSGLAENEDLQMAADIAAFFSRAKRNKRVPVVMASTNKLQRISGELPGTVRYRDGQVLWAEPCKGMKHMNLFSS